MTDRVFLDTNVLVYAYNAQEPEKQRVAQDILRTCLQNENGVLSAQVIGEFFNVMTRKVTPPVTVDGAREIIKNFDVIPVQEIDREMVHRAIDTHQTFFVSYWDALIIAAAERSGCRRILTEDLDDGQQYHGLTVINPFKRASGEDQI